MEKFEPLTLEDLKKKRIEILKDLNKSSHPKLLDRLAVWITKNVGSMGFFLIIFVWTISWLSWNMLGPKESRFDPYPGFVLWLFISNMIQLFLMPLIMLGQNVQSKHADLRADVDLKINSQAELENETIVLHLERQNKIMIEILKNIEQKTEANAK